MIGTYILDAKFSVTGKTETVTLLTTVDEHTGKIIYQNGYIEIIMLSSLTKIQ